MRMAMMLGGVVMLAVMIAGCGGGSSKSPTAVATTSAAATAGATKQALTVVATAGGGMTLTSTAFADGATIPVLHTCSGAGTSPALAWTGAPVATKSFVLIVSDPDAPLPGGFVHWVVYDLPASATKLDAATPAGPMIRGGGTQGSAGTGTGGGPDGYAPACPPMGATAHHYNFKLYALDTTLGLDAGTSRDAVLKAIEGHVVGQAVLVGLFGR